MSNLCRNHHLVAFHSSQRKRQQKRISISSSMLRFDSTCFFFGLESPPIYPFVHFLRKFQFIVCVCSGASVVPSSLLPYRSQPARLLCPWDSPDKNVRMACHFPFQGFFLTQGLNPQLIILMHWQVGSLLLGHILWGMANVLSYFEAFPILFPELVFFFIQNTLYSPLFSHLQTVFYVFVLMIFLKGRNLSYHFQAIQHA